MFPDAVSLPNDVDTLKALLLEKQGRIDHLEAKNALLQGKRKMRHVID
jgi:hypothetical protein